MVTGLTGDNLVIEIPEEDMGRDNLLMAMTGDPATANVLHDLSGNVSDDNQLSWSDNSAQFDVNSDGELVPAEDIAAATQEDAADDDDTTTTHVDESMVHYTAPAGGEFSNGETKTNVANDDVTYKFTVTASDSANSVSIPVVLTIDVNEPVGIADPLPSHVTQDSTSMNYVFTAPDAIARTFEATMIELDTVFSNDMASDDVDYDVETATRPGATSDADPVATNDVIVVGNRLVLTNVETPTDGSQTLKRTVKVNAMDDFIQDTDGEVDATMTFDITVTVILPSSAFVDREVPEDSAAGSLTPMLTVDGQIAEDPAGASSDISYAIYSQNNNGTLADPSFALNSSTGEITVVNGRDYENDARLTTIIVEVRKVDANGSRLNLGQVTVNLETTNVNEEPEFMANAPATLEIDEKAQPGANVGDPIRASDEDGDNVSYSIKESGVPFTVNSDGQISVSGDVSLDDSPYTVTLVATDDGTPELKAEHEIAISIGDSNDAPTFDAPTTLHANIDEDATGGTLVAQYDATDVDSPDNDVTQGVTYVLRDADDTQKFEISDSVNAAGTQVTGMLKVKAGLPETGPNSLDVDAAGAQTQYTVEVNVCDAQGACNEIALLVNVDDVNENSPVFDAGTSVTINVNENTPRGTPLASAGVADGVYSAPDGDLTEAFNTVTYRLHNTKSFAIDSTTGKLTVLESLDADDNKPCGAAGCIFDIIATDGENSSRLAVSVNVLDAEDSVSTFKITKANPVPGVSMGNPYSALADTKTGGDEYLWNLLDCPAMLELVGEDPAHATSDPASKQKEQYCVMWDGLSTAAAAKVSAAFDSNGEEAPMESPYDLPATQGSAPDNFVEADWASWDTIVRVQVTAESPDNSCGNGNQCVFIDVESDSAGNELRLKAYRSASQDNLFITAVKIVEKDPTDDGDNKPGDRNDPVDMDGAGGVVRLEADEEDEISFRLVGSTAPPIKIDVENEDPEFNNFMPEHESAFDDGDVEYTFTVTDPVSGIPEPEDLAGDTDGDRDYMPLVALISDSQCHSDDEEAPDNYSMYDFAGNSLWCASKPEIRQIVDDRDFDEIDDGFEVSTEIVLAENIAHYVTFIVCDNAGNCAMYTPDENDTDEAFAEITIDTVPPELIEARTGVAWDATDSKYDDDSMFIQLLFRDLTALDPTSIETDDFVVEGHTIKAVHWYDVSDTDDDTRWGDDDPDNDPKQGDFAFGGSQNLRDHPLRQSIRNAVFIELEDELAPDETPDVTIVPNGILDSAGKEQDDNEVEADDWIAPSFTVVSIVSPGTPEGSSNQLAGDNDEVVITLTADERIQQTRPIITVTHVNAPAGCVNTVKSDDYARGEIKTGGDCGDRATGGTLGTTFERISNTEWVVTVDEPDATGYYNIHIEGNDRSEQRNKGSEGIAPGSIVTKFFERDGDVNSDDAHYFQGDRNLSNPGVRVSGVQIEDTEPTVEFKTPLFVELDFTRPYIEDCADDLDDDERDANCFAESDEYAKDSFDSVTVTSFTLNGVDMTDSVKTTDDETFLVSIEGIEIGDHEIEIMAMDEAGNTLDKALSVEFEVEERDDFSKRLNPGWNLVSIPGEPADSDISTVFGHDLEVRTVYTYNPIIPGGWMVAVRESADAEWQGDLKEITARQGYWVLSDAIQDWDVSIPRLAGGAVGSGTPIQPPVIALYAGWNLVPVIDVTGDFSGGGISAGAYLQSLDDGLDLARVLGFDTITNKWSTVMAPEGSSGDDLEFGRAYWVFVRQAASLVPGN